MAQIDEFQSQGVAATVKHWPGEGYDDRDQHLVTTINPLTMAQWEATFGRLYRAAIAQGVMSVMSAHIAFPAYVLAHDPDAGLEAYRPASTSRLLNQTLLRDELGFNGLIVSDATPMAGLGAWVGVWSLLPLLLLASVSGLIFGVIQKMRGQLGHNGHFAFGPFLALSGFACFFLGISMGA